jgi:hypothetical protein
VFKNPIAEKINKTLYVIREEKDQPNNPDPIVVMFAFTKIYVSSSFGHAIYDISRKEDTAKTIDFSKLANKDFDFFKLKLIVFDQDLYVNCDRFWKNEPFWQTFVTKAKEYLGYDENTTDKDILGEQLAYDYLLIKAKDYLYIDEDEERKPVQAFDSWSYLHEYHGQEWENEIYKKMTETLKYETVIDIDIMKEAVDSAVCAVVNEVDFSCVNRVFTRFYQAIKVITSNFTYDDNTNSNIYLKDLDRNLF